MRAMHKQIRQPLSSIAREETFPVKRQSHLHSLACVGLLLNVGTLGFAWFTDILKISTAATIRLPFGLQVPVMREQNTFSLFGSLSEFYETGQLVVFVIIAVFGIAVPVAKLVVSAFLVMRSGASYAEHLLGLVHRIGRWAMLDVFALAIVTASLKLGDSVSVELCPGFYWFAAAALLPMFNGIIIKKVLQNQTSLVSARSPML